MPVVQFLEPDAEHKCELLLNMCRGMIDEWEASGRVNQAIPFRVGILVSLANDFANATPICREHVKKIHELIGRAFYNMKEPIE